MGIPKAKAYDPAKARVEATRRMVGNFDEWPRWPVLPMKKEVYTGRDNEDLGVMVEEDSDTYNIYLVNLFRLKDVDWSTAPVVKFDTIEDLIDNGWRVD
ncbi:MAG: hypothetical protein DMF62_04965 [Acidobacteria bacterium]|nr:MAG: hypothetical protein DMF62_04965 [Acidobacteriota bacterium]